MWMSGRAMRRGEAGNGSTRASASGSNSPYLVLNKHAALYKSLQSSLIHFNGLAEEKFVLIADG